MGTQIWKQQQQQQEIAKHTHTQKVIRAREISIALIIFENRVDGRGCFAKCIKWILYPMP